MGQRVLEDVAATLRPLAESKGLHFELQVPADDVWLTTDRRALNQIVINLANNAIKFTEHGHVRLGLEPHRDGSRATRISIEDSGIGIRPEDQARLFQAFEQVSVGSTRRHEGTGLGLHLSQKLALLLGGHIEFSSEFGKGSLFTLVLGQ